MSNEIILYDLASPEPCRSWSGNVWKTRLVLNYKGIPYRTEWLLYTELQQKLKETTGLPPNPPGSWSPYSVPTIGLPDPNSNKTTYIMDSAAIAQCLESLHPSPSLHLNAALEAEAQAATTAIFFPLVPYLLGLGLIDTLVAPPDREWFKSDRAQRFGMTVEELEKPKDADAAFAAARAGFELCEAVLTKYKRGESGFGQSQSQSQSQAQAQGWRDADGYGDVDVDADADGEELGPFIHGRVPCYADFCLLATMALLWRAGGECWERVRAAMGPRLARLWEASVRAGWLERCY